MRACFARARPIATGSTPRQMARVRSEMDASFRPWPRAVLPGGADVIFDRHAASTRGVHVREARKYIRCALSRDVRPSRSGGRGGSCHHDLLTASLRGDSQHAVKQGMSAVTPSSENLFAAR